MGLLNIYRNYFSKGGQTVFDPRIHMTDNTVAKTAPRVLKVG